ncbi:acyltransferase [Agarivorans sp. TSD2052]|uniref:acyltransferase family protein n=1 Tax=Agarivorans sp. TSD2052 TaxID=2937286 RepID=UPI00201025B2|nr:acyltransferase [Agarivorans sp. TSD2052]UPW19928.1 acyltransferase [Agarivorans sp. TSD2052]
MFGSVRTFWALMVVFGHIFWLSDFGRFAVFGFYILSGYLMTYVMQNSYGYSNSGRKRFALNRFLRLYPAYWFACITSLILLIVLANYLPETGFSTIRLPHDSLSILSNITMIFPHWIPHTITPRLSPATWALTVEIFFYIAICLGVSKTLIRTYIWLGLSIAFVVFSYTVDLFWHARYFSIPAGSLPFAIGSLIYFMVKNQSIPKSWNVFLKHPAVILILMVTISAVVAWLIPQGLDHRVVELLFYLNMLISALLVMSLAMGYQVSHLISKNLDKFIGDFSYPIYLLHYQASMIASVLLLGEVARFKPVFGSLDLVTVFTLLTLLSLIVIKCIDIPVERLRRAIRRSK